MGDYLDLQRQDRIAGLLPFSFDYGLNQLLCSLMMRCRLVLTRAIFTQEIARTIHGQAVTVCLDPGNRVLKNPLLEIPRQRPHVIEQVRQLCETGKIGFL